MPPAPQRSEPRVLKASDNLWCHVVSTQAAPQAGVPDLARKNPLSALALNESLFCLYSAVTEKESFTSESISEEEQDLSGTWKEAETLKRKPVGLKPLEAI